MWRSFRNKCEVYNEKLVRARWTGFLLPFLWGKPIGMLDMGVNVWKQVMDWYQADYYLRSPADNKGSASDDFQVIRGRGLKLFTYA